VYIQQRDSAITAGVETFCNAFSPWASENNKGAVRAENLAQIMRDAADTGVLIFSQPATFRFLWDLSKDGQRRGRVVVTPAFVKVTGDDARALDRPHTVIQQVIRDI
jgi:hypothetical protein